MRMTSVLINIAALTLPNCKVLQYCSSTGVWTFCQEIIFLIRFDAHNLKHFFFCIWGNYWRVDWLTILEEILLITRGKCYASWKYILKIICIFVRSSIEFKGCCLLVRWYWFIYMYIRCVWKCHRRLTSLCLLHFFMTNFLLLSPLSASLYIGHWASSRLPHVCREM